MYMKDVLIFFGLCILFLVWWHQRGIKDRALKEVARRCQRQGLQLLDETVQLVRLWPVKNAAGNLVLRRRYRFEFTSTGSERYTGEALMLGLWFEELRLPAYACPPTDDASYVDDEEPPRMH